MDIALLKLHIGQVSLYLKQKDINSFTKQVSGPLTSHLLVKPSQSRPMSALLGPSCKHCLVDPVTITKHRGLKSARSIMPQNRRLRRIPDSACLFFERSFTDKLRGAESCCVACSGAAATLDLPTPPWTNSPFVGYIRNVDTLDKILASIVSNEQYPEYINYSLFSTCIFHWTMGASCCSNPNGDKPSPASPPEEHNGSREQSACCGDDHGHQSVPGDHDGHAHGGCCGDDHDHESHDVHGQAGCCDASDCTSVMSTASTCCGSEERCDSKLSCLEPHHITSNTPPPENCIENVAALECAKACEDDPSHEGKPISTCSFIQFKAGI